MIGSVRVAIVGCGRMGAERANQAAHAGATIAHCADTDQERARSLAAQFGAKPISDAHSIPWRDIQAVFVCTPPSLRAVVLDAIAAGVAVFMEKPVGLTKHDGTVLSKAVESHPVVNAVGYMNRYRPSVLSARAFAEASNLSAVAAHWACKRYAVPWWELPSLSGGPFNEQATHLVDLFRYVAGDIAEVRAFAGPEGNERSISRAAVAIRFENGAVGTLVYTCEASAKHIGLHIVTTRGAVELRGWNFALAGADDGPEPNPFALETRAFLTAVEADDERSILCDIADATKTQSAVDDMRRGFAEGMQRGSGPSSSSEKASAV